MTIHTQKSTVFESAEGSIAQCDRRGTFSVQFFNDSLELKLCGLLAFRKKLHKVDVAELLSAETGDLALIYLPHCDRFFAFTVHEVLALRELMDGAMTILQLNSLIHRETIRKPAFLAC